MAFAPAEWTVEEIRTSLADTEPFPLPTTDDEAWNAVADHELTGPLARRIVDRAKSVRDEPIPTLPATSYLGFYREGVRRNDERTAHDNRVDRRRSRLSWFALAECLEDEGRFLDDVLDYAWAICEQESWVASAHLRDDDITWDERRREGHDRSGLPGQVADEHRYLDLYPIETALSLVEIDHVLGDRLHPALRELIRTEVDAQVFRPFEEREDFWWLDSGSNHNAVDVSGIVVLALHLLAEDPERQARIVGKAVGSLGGYLDGFGPDGSTPEGVGYWSYGFGHYLQAAVDLRARSGGDLDLLADPRVPDIARFPPRIEIAPCSYPMFSDAELDDAPAPYALVKLGEYFDHPRLTALGVRTFEETEGGALVPNEAKRFNELVRNLLWIATATVPERQPAGEHRRFFRGDQWWIARADPTDPETLAVAAKGGHNNEPHNHNDCGQFVVYAGERLIADLGAERYDADYFGDARYEYLATRSLGHSVPFVDGDEQAPGEEYAARVTDREETDDRDAIEYDLSGCYPNDYRVERRITLDRSQMAVTVRDETDAPVWESVLVTDTPLEQSGDSVVAEGVERTLVVDADPDASVDLERIPEGVAGRDVWRARFNPDDGELELRIELDANGRPE